jgi:hypothetical protein
MKEIRGARALDYARANGLDFSIDEFFLIKAETRIQHRQTTIDDLDSLLEKELGESYDPTKVIEGSSSYEFLLNRYGDGWIYVPLEGNEPLEEERAVMQLYLRNLMAETPRSGGDISDLATENPPKLENTGFPKEADPDLLFHAAIRLVKKGVLVSVTDPVPVPESAEPNYGNTYFVLAANLEVSLNGVLCEICSEQKGLSSFALHRECARRLKDALTNALDEQHRHMDRARKDGNTR